MIDNSKIIISFTYDGKKREIMGQMNQLLMIMERMKGHLSDKEFEKHIRSGS